MPQDAHIEAGIMRNDNSISKVISDGRPEFVKSGFIFHIFLCYSVDGDIKRIEIWIRGLYEMISFIDNSSIFHDNHPNCAGA